MAVEKFGLASLATFDDGRLEAAFAKELKRVQDDIKDRPLVKKPRSLSIKLILTPIVDEDARDADGASMDVRISASLPHLSKDNYKLGMKAGGTLVYSTEDPESICDRPITD